MSEHAIGPWRIRLPDESDGGELSIGFWRDDDLPVVARSASYNNTHKRGTFHVLRDPARFDDGRHRLPR